MVAESEPAASHTDAGDALPVFLRGEGGVVASLRALDWRDTLGPPAAWPTELTTLLSMMLASTQPMFVVWGPQHIWLHNDAFVPLLGRRPANVLGLPAFEVWPDSRETLMPLFARLYAGESASLPDVALELDRGGQAEEAHFTFCYAPVRDVAGIVRGAFGYCIETTGHVLGARQRQRSQARQTRMFEQAPGFIIIMSGPQHEVAFVNDSHRMVFGSDAWVGKPIRDAFPSIAGQGFFEELDRVYATGEVFQARDAEVRFRTAPDAPEQIRYLTFIYSPVYDEDGRIEGVFCDGFDVTESHDSQAIEHALASSRAEAARQQRLYEAILTNTPDLAYIFDLQHRFIYANEGLLKMWGYTAREALGKTCLELGYEPWHAQMHDREIDQVAATRRPIRGQVPFDGAFGRRIYDYIMVPVLNADGEVEAVAGTTRDVTDQHQNEETLRRLAEELAEADRRKTEFLAMLAHELRNPLAPISNAMHVIRNSASRPDMVAASTAVVQRQLAHMVRLVNDLMDISRISRGTIELRTAPVSIASAVAHAIETTRPEIEAARQTLSSEPVDAALMVVGDAVRLSQIFCNLLHNASKYSASGGHIALRARADGNDVEIAVQDDGIGIPPEKLAEIFVMFTQLDAPKEKARSGLGVGLSLVKTLVDLHGGQVQAASAGVGQGSTFTVRLPLIGIGD